MSLSYFPTRDISTTNVTNVITGVSNLESQIIVTQDNVAETLGGTIDSTKAYILDGIIDMGTTQVVVPTTGITIFGLSFDISGLTSSENNYTMFVSETPAIGSGNVLMADILLTASGTNSKVFELYDATGFNAFEIARVNFIGCTSLGDFYDYRQGLEDGTGRFGGTPNMTLHGTWVGGYRVTTSIVRSLSGSMTGALFQAGTAFSMNSRFLSDINCDLPASASLVDFAPSNFPNPSTLQFKGLELTRSGSYDADDTNLTPNVAASDLCSAWDNCNGLPNTFEGGRLIVGSEAVTTVGASGTWYTLNAATWTTDDLAHFSNPSAGELKQLGNSPRTYRVVVNFVIESTANNVIGIRLRKYDDETASFVDFPEVRRQVNNLSGSRDVAVFNFVFNVTLDINDYCFFQVRNNSSSDNCTLELDSDWFLEER